MPTLRESGDMGLVSRIAALQDKTSFKELHWDGTFEDYLKIVRENPRVTRTAFQRIYDMILSHGNTEYIDNKKRLIRYHFFHGEPNGGRDAVYGLDVPLMKLVNVFKSAAQGYGTEKRVILLHGAGGLLEEHHRAAAQERNRGVLAYAGRRALYVRVGAGEEARRRQHAPRSVQVAPSSARRRRTARARA